MNEQVPNVQLNTNDSITHIASSPSTDTNSSPNTVQFFNEEQSIVTQPLASNHEVPEDPEEEERKRKRNDDCCCAPYDLDEWDIYFLCRCIAWCCVRIGECTESCCEGCAECINNCCDGDGDCCNDGDCCGDGCDCDCSCFD